MTDQKNRPDSVIPKLYALAARLEGEGQLNNAKLVQAGAEAILRQAAYRTVPPDSKLELPEAMRQAIQDFKAFDISLDLTQALKHGTEIMESGRLPLIHETADVFVCRDCGHVILGEPETICPVCSARPLTFKSFNATYWLDALDPFESLERLRQTPKDVSALLEGLTEQEMNQIPEGGGWNIRSAISHLRDAQGVLEQRINLMTEFENPSLESKAVFEWAEKQGERPKPVSEIIDTYDQSRKRSVSLLEGMPLKDWWRTGEHEEFGTLTIQQQVSYFAVHEITHLPQIEALAHVNR